VTVWSLPPVGFGSSRTSKAGVLVGVIGAAVLAGYSGSAAATGDKAALVLPLAVVVGALLAALSIRSFAVFVMVMLAVRASVDISRVSGASAGNTAANTSSSRLIDPSSILAVLLLLAATVWLAAQLRQRGALPGSGLRRALLLFVAVGVVSAAGASHLTASVIEALRVLAIVVMFVVLEQLMRDPTLRRRLLVAAYASILVPLAYTTVLFGIGHPPSEVKGAFTRITGTFTQSNTFGRYLMLMIVFGVAVYPHLERKLRVWLAGILVLSSVYLFLTYTRTALVGAVIGLVVVGVLQSKRVLKILLVAAICALLVVPQLAGRFSSLTDTSSAQPNQPTGNSLIWRVDYWTEVLPLANSNPITGIGLNMTQYETDAAKQPHNDFIRAYVETGLLGLAAYIAMLVLMVRTGRRAVRRTLPGTLDRGIAVGFLGCAVAFIAVSAAANVLSNVVTLWYLVTFAAAASAISRQYDARDAVLAAPPPAA